MKPVAVCGWINVEITVPIGDFPIEVGPDPIVEGTISLAPASVAWNVASGLAALGVPVRFCAAVGTDASGLITRDALRRAAGIDVRITDVPRGARSVVLYDRSGRRRVMRDPADAPTATVEVDLDGVGAAVLTNVDLNRPNLARARAARVPVVVDVHTVRTLAHPHNDEFMRAADVLFMSAAEITVDAAGWLRAVAQHYAKDTVVMGLGAAGALLGLDRGATITHVPAVTPRPVVSTVGSGDALLSAFLAGRLEGREPLECLRRAVIFAGWKCGVAGGAQGFASAPEFAELLR